MHQGYSFCHHQKPPLKLEIESLFRQVKLYTQKQTNKKNIAKSIHSSLCPESKKKSKKIECLIFKYP